MTSSPRSKHSTVSVFITTPGKTNHKVPLLHMLPTMDHVLMQLIVYLVWKQKCHEKATTRQMAGFTNLTLFLPSKSSLQ